MDRIFVDAYDTLKARARLYLGNERRRHTLQATALVHEAWLRMSRNSRIAWQGETHVLAMASIEMRRILVDRARAARAMKRGQAAQRVTLQDVHAVDGGTSIDVLTVDEALNDLALRNPRQARVAEMRLFVGMTDREMGDALGVSERTVRGDWRLARAWLKRHVAGAAERGSR